MANPVPPAFANAFGAAPAFGGAHIPLAFGGAPGFGAAPVLPAFGAAFAPFGVPTVMSGASVSVATASSLGNTAASGFLQFKPIPVQLAPLLQIDPDFILHFKNGDLALPVHSVILRLNSTVMRDLLPGRTSGSSSSVSKTCAAPKSETQTGSGSGQTTSAAPEQTTSAAPTPNQLPAVGSTTERLTVDGSRAAWLEILLRCYAVHPASVDDLVSFGQA